MKILITPDSFKDSLSAGMACLAIEKGILKILPDAETRILPLADGGEGTVEAMITATGGHIEKVKAHDPLMREIDSFYGILGDGKTAVIEMAAASGIELLGKEERNPWHTTTYGTGELILHALNYGCTKIIVGLGGSATNDGGTGMATALGIKFLDKNNGRIKPGGGNLSELNTIIPDTLDNRIQSTEIIVACDVDNPLFGPRGASYTYGPQKGADEKMVKVLDKNLQHLSDLIHESTGKDVATVPGAGAAGGIGAGLMAFLDAELKPGFEIIKQNTNLENHIDWADLIITGEGMIDRQTQYGKTPFGVARLAGKHKKPVIAFAGTLGEGAAELYQKGFAALIPIVDKPMSLENAIDKAQELLEDATARTMILIKLGMSMT